MDNFLATLSREETEVRVRTFQSFWTLSVISQQEVGGENPGERSRADHVAKQTKISISSGACHDTYRRTNPEEKWSMEFTSGGSAM